MEEVLVVYLTGMSVSGGIWTFPTTGIYKVEHIGHFKIVVIIEDMLVQYGI